MTVSEVVKKLTGEGIEVSVPKIKYALLTHKIPSPPRDGAGNYQFSDADVRRIRKYMDIPHTCGRKPSSEVR
jgi:hypothetical protein